MIDHSSSCAKAKAVAADPEGLASGGSVIRPYCAANSGSSSMISACEETATVADGAARA